MAAAVVKAESNQNAYFLKIIILYKLKRQSVVTFESPVTKASANITNTYLCGS